MVKKSCDIINSFKIVNFSLPWATFSQPWTNFYYPSVNIYEIFSYFTNKSYSSLLKSDTMLGK